MIPLSVIKDRGEMLEKARLFFKERSILEVDTPLLTPLPSLDTHIDLIETSDIGKKGYLISSPEYSMKRLLAEGSGDIYQLSHVFRAGESGRRHSPEFLMAEWYRVGFTFDQMIEETADFISLFLGPLPRRKISYREALLQCAKIDPIGHDDEELNRLLAFEVEPKLGKGELTILTHYPASQAALAKQTVIDDYAVAERFEIYYEGIELCNGYNELSDSKEQRLRFEEANCQRSALGKEPYPIDEALLLALERLPPCCGVAVGVDRLMMLRHGKTHIDQILFSLSTVNTND